MKKRFRRLVVFITLMSMIMAFTVPVTAQDDVQSLTPENIYENVDPNGPLDTDVPGDPDLPIVPVQPDEPVIEPGFHCDAEGNVTYYDENGVMARGWRTINDKKYYFSTSTGVMAKGWRTINDKKYYFSTSTGVMAKGWRTINDRRYYFSTSTGVMTRGWRTINNKKYYFSTSTGVMARGWRTINNKKYYFSTSTGVMARGWRSINDRRYYFSTSTGVMARGWRTIGGYKYFFSKQSGAMLKGIYRIGDYKYFFSRVSGRMLTGLVKSRGNVYNIDSRGRIQRTIYGSKKAVALTYDDGPASGTKSIVKVLKDNNSVATFFVVGNRADIYSDSIKAASNAGCQIGCHTYSHPWLSTLSPSGISSQIKRGCSAVKRITGTSPTVCRTPGGETGSTIRNNVGMPIILWSVDTRDWATQDADSTYSAVINHVSDGDIVLMHDLHSSTATASKRIIPKLRKMGYQLVTVEELALLKGVNLKAGKVYYKF